MCLSSIMEFPFDINRLFSERVTVLDQSLVATCKSAERPELQAHISTVIDELGRASAKAQQLTAPITSASKLQTQKHQLYLLKDGESKGGRGVIVGFLKVGHKKLFLLDPQGVHIEAEPLCVLDFYIAENLQRHGYGLELFDFMLQHKNLEPVLMAYDRPSHKFLSFLAKHHFLTQSVPQVNNFVVFEGFFLNRSAAQLRKVAIKKPDGEIKPYSLMEREAVHQEQRSLPWPFAPPYSPRRSASHQCSHDQNVGSSPSRVAPQVAQASAPGGRRDQSPQSHLINRSTAPCTGQQGLVARGSLYSRHMDSRTVGRLNRQLPGLRAVGAQSYSLGYTDTHGWASIHTPQSRSPTHPCRPLCASKEEFIRSQTSVDPTDTQLDRDPDAFGPQEEIRVLEGPQWPTGGTSLCQRLSDCSRRGWSWTVGENRFTAQWVKQNQGYRSTRPW